MPEMCVEVKIGQLYSYLSGQSESSLSCNPPSPLAKCPAPQHQTSDHHSHPEGRLQHISHIQWIGRMVGKL